MRLGGRKHRLTAFQAGLVAIVLIVIGAYLGFTKDIPFTRPFELSAVFENAPPIQKGTAVRIAGVDVGKVSKVEPLGDNSPGVKVTMKLEDEALPIHEDAEVKARQRIFLEGNLFMDIKPGSPSADSVEDGDTIPATQTAAPVQFDQVLGTLDTTTREDLRDLLEGFGDSLNGQPQPGEDDDQDPDVKGETAAEALNDSLDYAPEALRGAAIVNQATLGREAHDLSKLIAGQQKIFAALASREIQLKDLITNFNITVGALATEQQNLGATIHELPEVLEAAQPALDNLNAAFPSTRAWALEMIPGVEETPATIEAGFPWVAQTRALMSPNELQGLVNDLQPAIERLRDVHRRPGEAPAGRGRLQPLPARRRAAERRTGDPGRRPDHRDPELQGVLPVAVRARRGRPELHRQRLLHALPARRRRQPGLDRHGHR